MTTAAIVLAAGESKRLGRPKQLVRFGGRSLVRRTVDVAAEAGCEPVLVVVGAAAALVQAELSDTAARVTINPRWTAGISSSIRCGISALDAETFETLLLLTCDQPLIETDVLLRILGAYDGRSGCMVACEYAGTLGVPALFERSCIEALKRLEGDSGAKRLLLDNPNTLCVDWPQGAIDIDRPQDLIPGSG